MKEALPKGLNITINSQLVGEQISVDIRVILHSKEDCAALANALYIVGSIFPTPKEE